MKSKCKWAYMWLVGTCCGLGLSGCTDTIGSFVIDYIVAPMMGKTP